MKSHKYIFLILLFFSTTTFSQNNLSRQEIINIIEKANNYWQSTHITPGNPSWDVSAYHTGNMEAYFITKNEEYLKYSEVWAKQNQWKGAKSNDKSKWKYSYGETDNYVLFGDWQICFQTYIDLYNLSPDSIKIARASEVLEYQMKTPNKDYWWWADGLYMAMPIMTNTKCNYIMTQKLSEKI